jgi:hypothetical protein
VDNVPREVSEKQQQKKKKVSNKTKKKRFFFVFVRNYKTPPREWTSEGQTWVNYIAVLAKER